MKKKYPLPRIKIDPPPFFKDGSLVFVESGHLLRLSNNYYRCDLDCRGKCKEKEGQFKKENLERNFTRFATKFGITAKGAENIVGRLLKDAIIRILNEEDDYTSGEIMETTIEAVKRDIKNKKKIRKSDVKDFEKALIKSNTINSEVMLLAYISGVIRSLAMADKNIGIGRDLAMIVKKLGLSKKGEIINIEFEKWGWYILNYIDKKFPNYLNNLKSQGINITNKKDESINLNIDEAVTYFSKGDFKKALDNSSTSFFYSIFSVLEKMIKIMSGGDPEKIKLGTLNMMQEFASNPAINMALQLAPLMGVKIKKKK